MLFRSSFFRPVTTDKVQVIGRVIKAGKSVSFCEAEALSIEDDDQILLAKMSSSVAMVDMPEGWVPENRS